ncbi:unnamed protein product [Dibothriocephalus latus]|uniref:Reverse transcriptase domain-containing protein n=1 Tax=Dibothriocephalus latus TaxID=60516 RepID=A0A3P6S3T2_DIBLA|nr:unnamed protein product [Dibothriocephalus latus]
MLKMSDSVCDVNGSLIADNVTKLERWLSCDPPSEAEMADAIKGLRNNKAPGDAGIRAGIYKSCAETLAP